MDDAFDLTRASVDVVSEPEKLQKNSLFSRSLQLFFVYTHLEALIFDLKNGHCFRESWLVREKSSFELCGF